MHNSSEICTEEELNHIFAKACCAQADGRLVEAEGHYLRLLRFFPEAPVLRYNLGLVYYSRENYSQALGEFSLARDLHPEDADICFNLALCRKKSGDIEGAIVGFRELLAIMDDHADCWYNLGGCYRDLHDDEQAVSCYRQVLVIDPEYLPAVNNLGYIHHRLGEVEQATICYEKLLSRRPEDEAVQYMLGALLGTPLASAPDTYVRNFFDTYAERFEESLVDGLGYDTPRELYICFARSSGGMKIFDSGLDLGCGTGLAGVAFKEVLRGLDGVDLSGNMLQLAAEKRCYNNLYQDTIGNYLKNTTATYDFFLATDVFIYVGELQEIFTSLRAVARPGALFCFSTEHQRSDGYRLLKTGRFAYSSEYIRCVAATTGWVVLTEEKSRLRKEREDWLEGRLWILGLD